MPSRIKIILKQVHVKKDGRFWGKAKWQLAANAGPDSVGDKDAVFVVKNGSDIALPKASWHAIQEVTKASKVTVKVHAKEKARFFADDFGSLTRTLKWPFTQGTFTLDNMYYKATFEVELEAQGEFKQHNPSEVFACRQTTGNPKCTTVSGATKRVRIEVCDVRPTPPVTYLPTRLPGGGEVCFTSSTGKAIAHNDDINVLPNPAAIPIIAKKDATKQNSARIEIGFYQPSDIKLTADDDRLEWKITSGAANAALLGPKKGMGVYVYGIAKGEIKLQLDFLGTKVAEYRAAVLDLRTVRCRVNLLDGGPGFKANSSAADVEKQIAVANRILRQSAVELKLDPDATTSNGAVKLKDGIFRVPLSAAKKGLAKNLSGNFPAATRLNRRPEILSLVYCVDMASTATDGTLGEAIAHPFNNSPIPSGGSFPQLTDSASPSSSWISPSGVYPHAAATAQTIEMMQENLDPSIPAADRKKHWAVTLCNGNSTEFRFGNTLAHEVGHALGLAHREATQDLLPELNQNLMHATEGPSVAQDLDILQTRVIHNSPLVT